VLGEGHIYGAALLSFDSGAIGLQLRGVGYGFWSG